MSTFLKKMVPSGAMLDLLQPDVGAIHVTDFAHHLSNTARWTGGSAYSVASHSCAVADICYAEAKEDGHPCPAFVGLLGLWHDGHEAVLGDVNTGLKGAIREVTPVLDNLAVMWDRAIFQAVFPKSTHDMGGLDPFNHFTVRDADRVELRREAEDLFGWGFEGWVQALPVRKRTMLECYKRKPETYEVAKASFMLRHNVLVHQIEGGQ